MAYSERSVDFGAVAAMLARDPQRLLDHLGLTYRREGVHAFVQDGPASGKNSFCVFLNTGTYKDFASGRPKGDMVDLIGLVLGYRNQLEALKWAKGYLGLSDEPAARPSDEELARLDAAARERRQAEAKAAADKSARLHGFWKTLPTGKGAVVEAYLREGRGITLDRLRAFPGALHYQARREHINRETGEVTEWPAMVALIQNGERGLGLHCTYLRPDGSSKAPVLPSKMMHGTVKGGWVPIARGEGGLRPTDAIKKGQRIPLIIGEGIETTLTVAAAVPEYRAIAALSLSNMALPWPPYASEVILLRENDTKPQAVAMFGKVLAHWQGEARRNGGAVRAVASPRGSDFNDMVRA